MIFVLVFLLIFMDIGAKLRIFTIASSKSSLEEEQRNMATLLSRFRVQYSDVIVIPDIARKPSIETCVLI